MTDQQRGTFKNVYGDRKKQFDTGKMPKMPKPKKGQPAIEDDGLPRYEMPDLVSLRLANNKKIMATVKLAAPVCQLLEFKTVLKPSTKIANVVELIAERHGGSIRELSVCVNRFHPEEIVSPDSSLEDCGVVSGDCIIYYDFVPTSGALIQ